MDEQNTPVKPVPNTGTEPVVNPTPTVPTEPQSPTPTV